MHVFERGMHHSSVRIAKERLKSLLVSDRVQCQPDTYELLCGELYHTIGKYMKITEDNFKVEITRSQIRINLTGEKNREITKKDKTLSFKRCEIRSGHFCYCYIDYWSYGNRKCKAGSTGMTDHRTCRRSDPDDHSFDDRLCMASELLLDFIRDQYHCTGMCKAVWNQCKWCTAVDRYRSDEFSAIRAQQNTGCLILCKISDES